MGSLEPLSALVVLPHARTKSKPSGGPATPSLLVSRPGGHSTALELSCTVSYHPLLQLAYPAEQSNGAELAKPGLRRASALGPGEEREKFSSRLGGNVPCGQPRA